MKSLFNYTNYRLYLAEYYNFQKERHSYFSYRYFSNKAGFKTKDFIYRVIQGQRNISRSSCLKISKGIGHTKREAEYFEYLVEFNQARDQEEKEFYLGKLQVIGKKVSQSGKSISMTLEQHQVFSNWYHLVIRSIIDLHPFKGDYEWLAKKVQPTISPAAAKKSVALLVGLGLVEKEKSGTYRVTEKSLTTGDEVSKLAVQKYYLESMKVAGIAMDKVSADQRNVTGLILGISKKGYQEIVNKLKEFRKEASEIARMDAEADRVYKMQLHFFPVSSTEEIK